MKLNRAHKKYVLLGMGILSVLIVASVVVLALVIKFNAKPKLNEDYLFSKKSAAFQYQITPKRCEGKHKLLIYSKAKEVQSIELPTDYEKSDCNADLIIEDVNFDSYEDVAVYKASGGAYNSPTYTYFTYNPNQGKFVFDDQLNKLNLRGAEFSSFNKGIYDFVKISGYCGFIERRFGVYGDKVYQNYERTETCSDPDNKATTVTKYMDSDGRVTETKEETRNIR